MPFLPRSLMTLTTLSTTLASAQDAGPPACCIGDEPTAAVPAGDGRFCVLDTVFQLLAVLRLNGLVPFREEGLLLCDALWRLHDAK